jgi:hypothetical protein
MAKKLKVLILADLHCGHISGLTHPDYFGSTMSDYVPALWKRFSEGIKYLGQIDHCVVNGDCIDGRGERSGGSEVWTGDRLKQAKCAIKCLSEVGAKNYHFTYGTPYHVGSGEDFEKPIAEHFKARISGQLYVDFNGLMFHFKHKVGASSIPHGRLTPIARQKVWNLFWADNEEAPKANIFIRSHTHSFGYGGGSNWLGVTTPALQGWGSKFGERQCEGTVDWGWLYFEIDKDGSYTWRPFIYKDTQKSHVQRFTS